MYSDKRGMDKNHPRQNLPNKTPRQNYLEKNPGKQMREIFGMHVVPGATDFHAIYSLFGLAVIG